MAYKDDNYEGYNNYSPGLLAVVVPALGAAAQDNRSWWLIWVLVILALLVLVIWWLVPETEDGAPEEAAADTGAHDAPPPPKPDDLTRIEGIGPKVSRLLAEGGIVSFAQLAEADVAEIDRMLDEAGLTMMDPKSWPKQAALAQAGKWDELATLQDELKGGR